MGSDDLMKKRKKSESIKIGTIQKKFKESILIICEGEKTEPNYFGSFPNTGVKVKIIGRGKDTVHLVDSAIKLWKDLFERYEVYENLYVVMDKDEFKSENYNLAFKKLKNFTEKINRSKKYKKYLNSNLNSLIIYTNESFELWYLLHYSYYNTAISRDNYFKLLKKHLNRTYRKNDVEIYSLLKSISEPGKGLQFAINNARKLRLNNGPQDNPSTNVDLLVKDLLDKYYELKEIKTDKYFYP